MTALRGRAASGTGNTGGRYYSDPRFYDDATLGMPNERRMLFIAAGLFLERAMRMPGSRTDGFWRGRGVETRDSLTRVSVLDMCCGTGNFANQISLVHPKIEVTGIDFNEKFVTFAKEKFGDLGWKFVSGDAVTYSFGTFFDFILMSSAYHHIEDGRKADFLSNARRHMRNTGDCLVCDNFLPDYSSKHGRESAITRYYMALAKHYEENRVPKETMEALREVEKLEVAGVEEHKVSYRLFLRDAENAGLRVVMDLPVWQPEDFQHDNAGSHVILLRKS